MYTCTSTVYRATFPLSVSQLSALIILNVINVNTKKIVGDDLAIVGGLFIDKRRSLVINIINVITGVRRNHFPNRSESFFFSVIWSLVIGLLERGSLLSPVV